MKYILILEDDGDLAAGMEMALMGDDFVFTVCGSIKEAEERLRQQAFDLLILDVNLPDGSGFELCRKIRKNSKVSIICLRLGIWSWILYGDWNAVQMIISQNHFLLWFCGQGYVPCFAEQLRNRRLTMLRDHFVFGLQPWNF